jgi:lipoprotein signal peptidase
MEPGMRETLGREFGLLSDPEGKFSSCQSILILFIFTLFFFQKSNCYEILQDI